MTYQTLFTLQTNQQSLTKLQDNKHTQPEAKIVPNYMSQKSWLTDTKWLDLELSERDKKGKKKYESQRSSDMKWHDIWNSGKWVY